MNATGSTQAAKPFSYTTAFKKGAGRKEAKKH